MKTPKKHRNFCHEGRTRVTVWLENKLVEKVRFEAKERYISQQSIIESAIRDAYKPPIEDLEALVSRRFNYVDERLQKIDLQSQITAEAVALFLRLWLITAPKIVEGTKASQEVQEDYRTCLATISRRMTAGETMLNAIRHYQQ